MPFFIMGSSTLPQNSFDGFLDDIRWYSHTLDLDQINTILNYGPIPLVTTVESIVSSTPLQITNVPGESLLVKRKHTFFINE